MWFLGIELKLSDTLYNIYGLYNRCSEAKYIEFLSDFCENEIDFSKINVIVGDVNIDLMSDYHYSKKLKECINDSTMNQIITEPTRITSNSRTLIDHVMTNDVNLVKYNILNDELISDHSTVQLILSESNKPTKRESINVMKYNTSELSDFFSENACDFPQGGDVNRKTDHFMSVIKRFTSMQTKSVQLRDKSDTKWYNSELQEL